MRRSQEEPRCTEFTLADGTEGFAVEQMGRRHAYRNRCPHTGAPLNWSPGVFLSEDGLYIQCALHGALFRIDDGMCVYGPCAGRRLEAVSEAEQA